MHIAAVLILGEIDGGGKCVGLADNEAVAVHGDRGLACQIGGCTVEVGHIEVGEVIPLNFVVGISNVIAVVTDAEIGDGKVRITVLFQICAISGEPEETEEVECLEIQTAVVAISEGKDDFVPALNNIACGSSPAELFGVASACTGQLDRTVSAEGIGVVDIE